MVASYATAKELRKAASAAKRAAEVVALTARDCKYLDRAHPLYLTDEQIVTLNEASKLLTQHNKEVAKLARKKAKEEREFNAARLALVPEAETHIAAWPMATIADKVAFCVLAFGEFSGLQSETKPGVLDMWADGARLSVINTATLRAVHIKKPISELMDSQRSEFDALRGGSDIAPIVQHWEGLAKVC